MATHVDDSPWNAALIEQNRRWLLPYMHSLVGSPEDAQDLIQQVFLVALQNKEKFDGERPLGAWLRGIAKNVVRQHWKKKGRLPVLADDETLAQLDYCASLEEGFGTDDDGQSVRISTLKECLRQLTQRLQEMFRLKYGESLGSQAIGQQFSMQENTVNQAMSRGRKMLASCIQKKLLRLGYE